MLDTKRFRHTYEILEANRVHMIFEDSSQFERVLNLYKTWWYTRQLSISWQIFTTRYTIKTHHKNIHNTKKVFYQEAFSTKSISEDYISKFSLWLPSTWSPWYHVTSRFVAYKELELECRHWILNMYKKPHWFATSKFHKVLSRLHVQQASPRMHCMG